jgi:hypothetical protein
MSLLEWFRSLFCAHEYRLVSEVTIYADGDTTKLPSGHKLVYVCDRCLKHKIIEY